MIKTRILVFLVLIYFAFSQENTEATLNQNYPCYINNTNNNGTVLNCTANNQQVCGYYVPNYLVCVSSSAPCGTNFPDSCAACRNSYVNSYSFGKCSDANWKLAGFHKCTSGTRNLHCTNNAKEVCAWFRTGILCGNYTCAFNATNLCSACRNPYVDIFSEGVCPY
jgi:hypothetical protein